jgi:hypothetical protein
LRQAAAFSCAPPQDGGGRLLIAEVDGTVSEYLIILMPLAGDQYHIPGRASAMARQSPLTPHEPRQFPHRIRNPGRMSLMKPALLAARLSL